MKRKFSGGGGTDLRHKTEPIPLVTPGRIQAEFVTQPQFR